MTGAWRVLLVLPAAVVFHPAPTPLAAQQRSAEVGANATAPAIAEAVRALPLAPEIDGVLDDPAWQSAPVFSGFVQRDPNEGEPATEPTEFRVVYTNDDLFVGVRAFDSQADEIAALLTRRDEWSPSDEVALAIDSYHDRRTAFRFAVNAAGVKRDAFLFDDNNEDDRWDAVWDVATRIDAEGWTAEFRIPFSQLRFSKADTHTFGFNMMRRVNRLNEEQFWRLLPKSASGVVSLFGDLTGIEGIVPPRRLEILPYTVASEQRQSGEQGNPFNTGSDRQATIGADVKYGLTSALTLTATVNPDFGQVEADPAVVNLSAFESFFPERRPFFNEGLDIFQFGIGDGDGDGAQEGLFYTRRIGRTPQGEADDRGGYAEELDQTTIVAAAKISGKTRDGWTIGLTGALTDQESAAVIDSVGQSFTDVVEPRSGYLVGRLAKDFRGGQTVIGLFGTTVQRSLPEELDFLHSSAYTGGLDWRHRFRDDTYSFRGRIVGSYVEGSPEAIEETQQSSARYYQRPDADYLDFDPTRTSLSGSAIALSFGKHGGGSWRWSTGFDRRSPGLEVNDIGFQREADRTLQYLWVNRRWLQPGKVFRRFNLNFNQWSVWTTGWDRRNLGGNVNANFTLLNYWAGWFGMTRNLGGLNVTELRGGPAINSPSSINGWAGFQSDERKPLRAEVWSWGFMQDETDSWGGGVGTGLAWRPATNVDLQASPEINWNRDEWQYVDTGEVNGNDEYIFGDLHQTTVSMTFRGNLTFSPTLSLQLYAQPFLSSGRYERYRRVTDPRAEPFWAQFETFDDDQITVTDDELSIDVDRDGAGDVDLDVPDFTVLSFRSNVVLRWEYSLGSTLFLVWQHGRNEDTTDGRFRFGAGIGDLFRADAENVFLVKVNYWISP